MHFSIASLIVLLAGLLSFSYSAAESGPVPFFESLEFHEPVLQPVHPFGEFAGPALSVWWGRPYGLVEVLDFSVTAGFRAGDNSLGVSLRTLGISDIYRGYRVSFFDGIPLGRRLHLLAGAGVSAELFAGDSPHYWPSGLAAIGWTAGPFLRIFGSCDWDSLDPVERATAGLVVQPGEKGAAIFAVSRLGPDLYRVRFGQRQALAPVLDLFWGVSNQPVQFEIGAKLRLAPWGAVSMNYGSHSRLGGSPRAGFCLRKAERGAIKNE